MALLGENERKRVIGLFEKMTGPVRLMMFTQDFECDYCRATRELLEELAPLSDRLSLSVHDFVAEADLAKRHGVDKAPATLVMGEADPGIRFYGVPSGYEFGTLIEDILNVSSGEHGLSAQVLELLSRVDRPVHLQVLVSPTCPYCPRAVITAHRFAMASPHVHADMVEVTEFPHLAVKYNVQGVPHTVVNEVAGLVGAVPEIEVAQRVVDVLAQQREPGAP